MSRSCEYYQELMSRMLDAELLPAEAEALREHARTCSDCRTLTAAFSGVVLSLRDDPAEPPESLVSGVMARIGAYENAAAEPETPAPEPVPIENVRRRGMRPWAKAAIAACLVAVIGLGGYSAFIGQQRSRASSASAESIMMDYAVAESAAATAEEEMPAPMAEEPAQGAPDMMLAAETEEDWEAANADYGARAVPSTIDEPLFVPDGREAEFEAVLQAVGNPETDGAQTVAYVEYRGVIYEFTTDGENLFWRDAAEGMPALSPASVDELWDILG